MIWIPSYVRCLFMLTLNSIKHSCLSTSAYALSRKLLKVLTYRPEFRRKVYHKLISVMLFMRNSRKIVKKVCDEL